MHGTTDPSGSSATSAVPCGMHSNPVADLRLSKRLLRCIPVLAATKQPPEPLLAASHVSATRWYSGLSWSSLQENEILASTMLCAASLLPESLCSAGFTNRWKHTRVLTGFPASMCACNNRASIKSVAGEARIESPVQNSRLFHDSGTMNTHATHNAHGIQVDFVEIRALMYAWMHTQEGIYKNVAGVTPGSPKYSTVRSVASAASVANVRGLPGFINTLPKCTVPIFSSMGLT
jgi:hypothetical protein